MFSALDLELNFCNDPHCFSVAPAGLDGKESASNAGGLVFAPGVVSGK